MSTCSSGHAALTCRNSKRWSTSAHFSGPEAVVEHLAAFIDGLRDRLAVGGDATYTVNLEVAATWTNG